MAHGKCVPLIQRPQTFSAANQADNLGEYEMKFLRNYRVAVISATTFAALVTGIISPEVAAAAPLPSIALPQSIISVSTTQRSFTVSGYPRISGTMRPGHTVEVTGRLAVFSPDPTGWSFQWMRGDTPIPGATGRTYQLRNADAGARISVRVTATRSGFRDRTVRTPVRTVQTADGLNERQRLERALNHFIATGETGGVLFRANGVTFIDWLQTLNGNRYCEQQRPSFGMPWAPRNFNDCLAQWSRDIAPREPYVRPISLTDDGVGNVSDPSFFRAYDWEWVDAATCERSRYHDSDNFDGNNVFICKVGRAIGYGTYWGLTPLGPVQWHDQFFTMVTNPNGTGWTQIWWSS